MNKKLILVTLNEEQIGKAKEVNGKRKQITHAVICGSYGQIFGTKKHCHKYFSAWQQLFEDLFDQSLEAETCDIANYESIFDMVNILIKAQDSPKAIDDSKPEKIEKKKGLFAKLFGK